MTPRRKISLAKFVAATLVTVTTQDRDIPLGNASSATLRAG